MDIEDIDVFIGIVNRPGVDGGAVMTRRDHCHGT